MKSHLPGWSETRMYTRERKLMEKEHVLTTSAMRRRLPCVLWNREQHSNEAAAPLASTARAKTIAEKQLQS
ncbi:unnamed protein product, partial [Nesidiocoris tenuis]